MKKNYSLLILFFYCLSMSYANKFALLIGVSNYPKQSNWIQLNAGNDLVLLNNTYQKLGFPKGNIEIIENEKATKQGIIQALKKLNTAVKSGDIVVFHFSGHGQQVMDITGDEIDGYDEAIVPYDAPKIFKKGQYEGQNHLLDEELGDLLQNIRKTLGYEGQLFVSIDACHSGSGTRSLTTARGTNQPLAARDYVVAHQQLDKAEKPHLNANNEAQLAPMIAFFSASPNELSYEFPDAQGKNYGSFSSALAITLLKANETTTYASIFEQIRIIMNIRSNIQNPQYEGAVNSFLFNGAFSSPSNHFKIKEKITNNLFLLDAGLLQNVNNGAEIAFYSSEIIDTATSTPIAIGKVSLAEMLDADVQITRGNIKDIHQTWAYLRQKSYATLKAGLRLDLNDKNIETLIVNKYKTQPFLTFVDKEEDLRLENKENQIRLISNDGVVMYETLSKNNATQYTAEMLFMIETWLRAKFLKQIELFDDDIQAELSIIGAANNKVKINDKIKIKITNKGQQGFYFSVLDIQPDNQINVLLPFGRPAIDYYLLPGKSYETDFELDIQPPIGKDMLKLICSAQALDLSQLIASRGATLAQNANPFEQLLAYSYKGARGGNVTISPKAVSVSSFLFEIVEK